MFVRISISGSSTGWSPVTWYDDYHFLHSSLWSASIVYKVESPTGTGDNAEFGQWATVYGWNWSWPTYSRQQDVQKELGKPPKKGANLFVAFICN